ncbi:cell adhesion molecule 4-like, partial [Serinus canaria]|uniref:cell adhesion molecule 4-like n=1 Tax=Serinus canaria TaxID=9135 RepID=UPI0021CC582A
MQGRLASGTAERGRGQGGTAGSDWSLLWEWAWPKQRAGKALREPPARGRHFVRGTSGEGSGGGGSGPGCDGQIPVPTAACPPWHIGGDRRYALRGSWQRLEHAPGRCQEVQAENVTVLEGGTAEITCHLHRYDGSIVVIQNPARQTLFFNGTRALKDERFELAEFSRRRLRLRLARARLEDEGGYFCQLYADDTHHQIATLTVLVPPEPPLVEAGALAVEGEELELTCLVPRARPMATLRWYRDRRELPGRSSHRQEGKVFWQRSVLHLRPERRDHGAIVTCEATHPALGRGQRRQTQYQLDVQYPPSVRIHPSQSVLREGDTLVLTCAINGNPRPTEVAW